MICLVINMFKIDKDILITNTSDKYQADYTLESWLENQHSFTTLVYKQI